MAIVKSIVEAHGGQVTVESRTASERSRGASGTTVRIRVPV
jgi:signal transduction histidine kinase